MTIVHIAIDLQDESEVARVLSLLNQEHVPHRVERKNVISDEGRAAARERMMQGGSQTLEVPGARSQSAQSHTRSQTAPP